MVSDGDRRWHNVRQNETTRIPRRYVFFDTEARIKRIRNGHVQTWRLAVACFASSSKGRPVTETWRRFNGPSDLWRDISEFASIQGRTTVWSHNLGYDSRISRVFDALPRLGWRLVGHNIAPRGTWLEWRRDKSTLLLLDSTSVFPTTIRKIGQLFGIGQIRMSMESDNDVEWEARCTRDVEILKTAILAYLEWIETDDLGNWQITGAGQSWATFRHKFLTHKMVVHDDTQALRAERRAMWAGRCEAHWKGTLAFQTVHEWDFSRAYATIARDHSVPVRLLGPMPRDYDWRKLLGSNSTAVLAKVRVETELPIVPTEHDGRIVWPVGTFETTLWDVEIKALLDAGQKVDVMEAWFYRKAPALRAWANWICNELDADMETVAPWKKVILKHWSRALIGRMAMTYTEWESWGTAPTSGTQRMTVYDRDEKAEYEIMQVGSDVWRDNGRVEWAESMPMVTGYVQAIARVQLWDLMQKLPEHALLYVDTDSVLVADRHMEAVAQAAKELKSGELRLKKSWQGIAIYGPRQVVTGDMVRISGVAKTAQRIDRTTLVGEVWDSLPGAIKRGSLGKVVVRDRTWRINGKDTRRDGDGIGWTRPRVLS